MWHCDRERLGQPAAAFFGSTSCDICLDVGAERAAAQGHGRRIAPLRHAAAGLPGTRTSGRKGAVLPTGGPGAFGTGVADAALAWLAEPGGVQRVLL